MDYSGFDRENWANRRREIHMEKVLHTLTAKTPAERSKLESSTGCRYSILLELPYFDPIQINAFNRPNAQFVLGNIKAFLQSNYLT